MSARITTSVAAATAPPAASSAPTGRVFVVGQTNQGPAGVPTLVRGLADYRAIFGGRTGGAACYDAVRLFFLEGGAEAWITRATGPAAVKALISLDTGKLVVTARNPGAYANGWTAAYTSATKTLTVVTTSGTETYTGTDIATLLAAAAASATVTVSSSGSLPVADVAATPLATGTDDFASTVWATALTAIPGDLGTGAIITPGIAHTISGSALAAHAKATNRLAILTAAQVTDAAAAATAATTIAALAGGEACVLAWPWVTAPDGASTVTTDPAGLVAGMRARAHSAGGPGQSLIQVDYGSSRSGAVPITATTDAAWATLDTANVSVLRTVGSRTRLYTWQTAAPFPGNVNLGGAQFRDLLNAITTDATNIAETYIGRPVDARGRTLAAFGGEIEGALANYAADLALYPRIDAVTGAELDPGYVVDTSAAVNSTAALAAGRITAALSVRLAPSAEFVSITVTAGDASSTF